MIKSYKDLDVWKLSFDLAMEIFRLTRKFPKEELYSLTSQIVRSSRSVSANITEGWAKRNYEKIFKQHLIDSIGSNMETINWLDFGLACEYISADEHQKLVEKIDIISKMLTKLHQNWNS
jgi:four helix bundle protein